MTQEADVQIPHFTLLPAHTEDLAEPARYDCSLCADDIFNISMHAQFEHGTKKFTVENDEEKPRVDTGVVGHLCGINGCSFDGNHEGLHSWQIKEDDNA